MRNTSIAFCLAFCIFQSVNVIGQVQINGPQTANTNDIGLYEADLSYNPCLYGYVDLSWTVTGGTILSQNIDPNAGTVFCQVRWDVSPGQAASVQLYGAVAEAPSGYPAVCLDNSQQLLQTKTVTIGIVSITPFTQYAPYYGGNVSDICVSLPNITITSYQWYTSLNPAGSWTSTGGSTACLTVTNVTQQRYYYCALNTTAGVFNSPVASVYFLQLSAGTISSSNQTPDFNSSMSVQQTPATGGYCSGTFQYSWEISVENGPWTEVGTSAAFPTGLQILGKTAIRRKVSCGIEILFTNVITLNPTYTSDDYENLNYVREITVLTKAVQSWQEADSKPIGEKQQSTTYLDGFGRAIQKVDKGISPDGNGGWKDMVQHISYDAAGRVPREYLPFSSSQNSGKFKSNAAADQVTYIQTFFQEPGTAPTYYLAGYDESPLNRMQKIVAPGEGWINKPVALSEEFNKENEKVHIWNLAYSAAAIPATTSSTVYSTGRLAKKTMVDEKGIKSISYTDINGNLVLTKVQEAEEPSLEHDGWVCTYYVYDDLGRLRFTIPDKAIQYLDANGWSMNQTLVDKLCFMYLYDKRGRLILKKQPEAGPMEMVYDERNRLIFSRDANQANAGQWNVSLHDALNRQVITGLMEYHENRETLQTTVVDARMATYPTPNNNLPIQVILNQPNISGTFNVLSSVTILDGFESATGQEFVADILNGPNGPDGETTILDGVAVNKNPLPDGVGLITLSVSFYDNYEFNAADDFNTQFTLAYTSSDPNVEATIKTGRTTGMMTGSKIRVIDEDGLDANDKFLYSTAYYDESGRIIQTSGDNYGGGKDYQVTQYDFSGKTISSYTHHNKGTGPDHSIIAKIEYDHVGRITALFKNFNNSFYKELAAYSYDELGQLKTKKLAPGFNGTQLEQLTYDYNIQGWLTGINKSYALGDNDYTQWDRFFGMYLGYENGDSRFAAAQYNGTITGVIWRSQGDNTPRKFDYTYDRLNRLTTANFNQRNKPSESSWSASEVDFTTLISYADGNGNLASMTHRGILPGQSAPVLIDDLRYSYLPTGISGLTGNRLQQVDDLGNLSSANNGLLGDFKDGNTTQDYEYDENGNLVKDLNKGLKDGSDNGVEYNFMNKPSKIIKEGLSVIEFVYDAGGVRLQKKVTYADNSIRQTTFLGDFVYEEFKPAAGPSSGEELLFVLHEEGRLKIITPHERNFDNDYELNAGVSGIDAWPGGREAVFEYFIKDHLGSTRMVLTEEYQKEYYKASMEASLADEEEPLFGQVDNAGRPTVDNELQKTRVTAANHNWPGNNTDVSRLTAATSGRSLGPNIILKVMAGDIVNSNVRYYFVNNNATGDPNAILADIAQSFITSLGASGTASAISKAQTQSIANSLNANTVLDNFLDDREDLGNPDAPKAFLNIVFLDEQFKFIASDPVTPAVGSQSSRVQYGDAGNANASMALSQKAPQNGWAFVFISNESDEAVLFDDLLVTQEHGRIAEENHYYPFGLKIAGISSRAVNKLKNKYGYQGDFAEHEEETGWDDFYLRSYDAQIGRFAQFDPYDQFVSGYVGMGNDPVNKIDSDGGWSVGFTGAAIGAAVGYATPYLIEAITGKSVKNKGLWGASGALLGAGIGYGIGETAFGNSRAGFFREAAAFYVGLVGLESEIPWINGGGGYGRAAGAQAIVPKIWGTISLPDFNIGNPFQWTAATRVMITEILLATVRLGQIISDPNVADGYPSYSTNISLPPNNGNLSIIIDRGIPSLYKLNYSGAISGSTNIKVDLAPDVRQILSNMGESRRQRDQSGINLEEIRRMTIRGEVQENNRRSVKVFEQRKELIQYKYLKVFGFKFFKLIRKKP